MKTYKSVDEYIKKAEKDKQEILLRVRKIILQNIKNVEEGISYGMPAYKYIGEPLMYFAAMKGHLGIYPTPEPIAVLKKDLEKFSTSKGCVRIPYVDKLPEKIILKLLKERVREIKENQKNVKRKK